MFWAAATKLFLAIMAMLYLEAKLSERHSLDLRHVVLLLEAGRVNVGHRAPLGDGLCELLEGVVHHELGLLPLEVSLHNPVPELLVLIQQLLQMILLGGAILAAKYPLKQLILLSVQT